MVAAIEVSICADEAGLICCIGGRGWAESAGIVILCDISFPLLCVNWVRVTELCDAAVGITASTKLVPLYDSSGSFFWFMEIQHLPELYFCRNPYYWVRSGPQKCF